MSSTGLPNLQWRKSSYSNGQANCVEVASMKDRYTIVAVRDSKAPDSNGLTFTAPAWQQFTDTVKRHSRSGDITVSGLHNGSH